ncbi:MAG TPA: GtrA family protein [Rhodopila sp.]|jgi:putative flippase GtrA|nr:GtrA family protein [Rhodopila sp.]
MQTTLLRLLPPTLRRAVTPAQAAMAMEFFRFGLVGLVGLVIDTATVYGTRHSLGLYGAGVLAYFVAATVNWALNRIFTFRDRARSAMHRQWAMFLLANLAGFVLNRGTYALLVAFVPLAAAQPVIATSAGSIAGMFVNFSLSRRLVFR